ncbi:MAG: endonuclease domain-containing protein [Culicoidibacterales bacterium]
MLLTAKTVKIEKERLYKEQYGICLICQKNLNTDIQKNHLDHDHALEGSNAGRVRGLLCGLCNTTEGMIKHKFNRSGLVAKENELVEWLENLLVYYKRDSSYNSIHPNYPTDMAKKFSRMSKPEMIAALKELSVEFDESVTKEVLVKLYKKHFRNSLK